MSEQTGWPKKEEDKHNTYQACRAERRTPPTKPAEHQLSERKERRLPAHPKFLPYHLSRAEQTAIFRLGMKHCALKARR